MSTAMVYSIAVTTGCARRAKSLPVYGKVPEFQLTDSRGRPFDGGSLNGKIWIVDFIYTQCPGPCPRMTSQMHAIEKRVKNSQDIRLISFTVDPAHDTPPVLNDYAHLFGGPTPQWYFLTGSPETLHQLARNVFMAGDLVGVMDHSTRFIVVDRERRIRGFYSTFDAGGISPLIDDVNVLRQGHS
jgi:protein SCO1